MDNKIKIGFTLGDVNGIGPEVLIKALEDKRILGICTPVIYGSNRIISFYKKMINAEGFSYTTCATADQANSDARQWLRNQKPGQSDWYLQPSCRITVGYRNVIDGSQR